MTSVKLRDNLDGTVSEVVAAVVVDSLGNEIDYSGPNLTGGVYTSTLSAIAPGANAFSQVDKFGGLRTSMIDPQSGAEVTYVGVSGRTVSKSLPSTAPIPVFGAVGLLYDNVQAKFVREFEIARVSRINGSAAGTNTACLSNVPSAIGWIWGRSVRTTICYLKLYDLATVPIVGVDIPKFVIEIPPNAPFSFDMRKFPMPTGLGRAFTPTIYDADTTGINAGDIVNFHQTYA